MHTLYLRKHMSWFEDLTGFAETDYDTTRAQLCVEGDRLRSLANGSGRDSNFSTTKFLKLTPTIL